MDKKNTLLVIVLLALLSVYVIFFTDWFKPQVIKLFYSTRAIEYMHAREDLPYVLFGMEGRYRLTEIKVVPKDHPDGPALWHLVSKSSSPPIKMFTYGERIYGMKAEFKGSQPQDLVTNVTYRLFVAAGRAKGQIDFQIK